MLEREFLGKIRIYLFISGVEGQTIRSRRTDKESKRSPETAREEFRTSFECVDQDNNKLIV